MARDGGMEGLGDLMRQVYPGRSEPDDVHTQRLLGVWRSIVSERIWSNARPVRFHRGVLTVHTATSAWANALQMDADTILERLGRRVAQCRVRSIRFRVGALPEAGPAIPPRQQPVYSVPVTELPEALARELASIGDDGLRDVLARAAAAGLGRRRRRPPSDPTGR